MTHRTSSTTVVPYVPCHACDQLLRREGIRLDRTRGWGVTEIIDIAGFANPTRGRFTAKSRPRAVRLSRELYEIAGTVAASSDARAVLPCPSCCSQVAEFKLSLGPLLLIGPSLAARLAPLVNPRRAPINETEAESVYRLLIGLFELTGRAMDFARRGQR